MVKNPPLTLETQEMWVQPLSREDPLEEEMAMVLLPGKSHGQRNLVGCSPWGGIWTQLSHQQQLRNQDSPQGRTFCFLDWSSLLSAFPQETCWKAGILPSLLAVVQLPGHGLQCTSLPCSPLAPGVCSVSYALIHWCHPTISKFA